MNGVQKGKSIGTSTPLIWAIALNKYQTMNTNNGVK